MDARIYNYRSWIRETRPLSLKRIFEKLLLDSGYNVLNFIEHQFRPRGYTCLWLLAESHFAIHTFPEKGTTYIELSGCNKTTFEQFKALLAERNIQMVELYEAN